MKTESVVLLIFLGLLGIGLARVMDDCCNFTYLTEHCIDMSVDYRDAANQYNSDTCRFKRNMRIGQNKNPNANKFFVVYKSSTGLDCFYTRLYFIDGASEESHFYRSNDGVNFVELNGNQAIWGPKVLSGDNWYYYDIWFVNLPARTHFVRLQFKDWINEGWINYWSPQISTVSFFEAGDPVCGDGVCGGSDHRNQAEDCHSCPQDCGACPTPTCSNGVCQYSETWAPRTGEHTTDLGYITCPEDCGAMYACGNERCDPGEVCGAQTQSSCAEDCCGMTRFEYYDGVCGNGLCDGNETCSSCPGDCGACPQCGDGQCNGLETCTSCSDDCGACPTLYNAQCVYPVARQGQTPIPVQVPVPVAPVAPPVTPPYALVANVIPGIIEAENYDAGGQDVAYHDTTPGNTGGALRTNDVDIQTCTDGPHCYAVAYIEAGEWLQFAVQVAQTGMYQIDARYAFPDGTPIGAQRQITVKIDGTAVAQLVLYPSGSYTTFAYCPAVQSSVPLTAGNHVMRLEFSQGFWNLNFMRFMLLPPAPPVAPVEPIPAPVSEPPVDPPVASAPVSPPVQVNAPQAPVTPPQPHITPIKGLTPSDAGTTTPQDQPISNIVSCANELISGVLTIILVLACLLEFGGACK